MNLLGNILKTLLMVYCLGISQIAATERNQDDDQAAHDTTKNSTSTSNDETSWKISAIQFYARNYGVINFCTIAVPITACSIYGMYSFGNYVSDSYKQSVEQNNQRIARYNQQREEYLKSCMVASKECNGTWIQIANDSCPQSLSENMCYRVLFDCASRLCDWSLLFCQNAAHTAAQLIVNGHTCP